VWSSSIGDKAGAEVETGEEDVSAALCERLELFFFNRRKMISLTTITALLFVIFWLPEYSSPGAGLSFYAIAAVPALFVRRLLRPHCQCHDC
jgi:hypothetical protein